MTDGNVYALKTPAQDTLNEVLKRGAQQFVATAVVAEVAALLAEHRSLQVGGKQAVDTCRRILGEQVIHSMSLGVPMIIQNSSTKQHA